MSGDPAVVIIACPNQLRFRLSYSVSGTSGGVPKGFRQPPLQIPVGEQIQTQHASQIREGPFRLREVVQPFQQQHGDRSEEHTSELQSPCNLVCRLLLEKKKKKKR